MAGFDDSGGMHVCVYTQAADQWYDQVQDQSGYKPDAVNTRGK